jgi:hypothetical protein
MVEQVIGRLRRRPRRLLADAGYCSEANLAYVASLLTTQVRLD